MFPINLLCFFALVLSTLTGAEPWLNLLTSNIIECGRVRFSCGGGRPPYRLTMLSPSLKNVYSNINADGVWEVPMPYPARLAESTQNLQVVFILEDAASSPATASDLMTVGTDISGSCSTTHEPNAFAPDFIYDTMPASRAYQCDVITFNTNLAGNINRTINWPLEVLTVLPGSNKRIERTQIEGESGRVWEMAISDILGPHSTQKLEKGAQVLYVVRDHDGWDGGASSVITIQDNPGVDCNNSAYTARKASKSLSAGAIAGIVVGSVVGVAVLLGLAFVMWRRRRSRGGPQETRTVYLHDAMGPEPEPFTGGYTNTDRHTITDRNANIDRNTNTSISEPAFSGSKSQEGTQSGGPLTTESRAIGGPVTGALRTDPSASGSPRMSDSAFGSEPSSSAAPSKGVAAHSGPPQPTYQFEADAGSVSNPAPVIVMPPMYNPDWQPPSSSSAPLAPTGTTSLPASKDAPVSPNVSDL